MLYNPINGACVAPSFYRISEGRPLPSHQRGIAGTSVRPKGSRTHSDAKAIHNLFIPRPSYFLLQLDPLNPAFFTSFVSAGYL